ncbi:MAG: NYN domain-containing protein [Solirubrobacteraceae bacterium]
MRVIVDAMNVIGARPDGWWRDRHAAMVGLVEQLERFSASCEDDVTVVFERPPRPPIASSLIEIACAPRAHRDSADDEIVRRVSTERGPQSIRVVTSDKTLAARVLAAGAQVETSGHFRRHLDSV